MHYLGTDVGPEDGTGHQTSGGLQTVATHLQALSVGETELAHLSGPHGGHHGLQSVTFIFWDDLDSSSGRPCWLFSNQTSPARPGQVLTGGLPVGN